MKHYLSIIATFKNESMNIKEWLDHYIWQGVDHFYLINNGSDDDFNSQIQMYKHLITLYEMPTKHSQVDHYNKVFNDMKQDSYWICVCDLDEFIFGTSEPIVSYLLQKEDVTNILTPWLLFGSTDDPKHPKSIRKTFKQRQANYHRDGKCFFKSEKTLSLHIHTHYHTDDNSITEFEKLKHFHYPIQSQEFFGKVKIPRGAADGILMDTYRNWDYFRNMDFREQYDDTLAKMVEKIENGEEPY